jgi:hypothetical protein
MFRKLFSRRGGVAIATVALGLSGMSLAFAGTAGAAPNATLTVGSGSQTSYAIMNSLSSLFDTSPGCDLTASTSTPLQLNCGTTSFSAGSADGQQGFSVAAENPYNDFTVQASPIGSTNGLAEIESSANYPADYARSSSGPSSSNSNNEMNFVQYAVDGVSWTSFKKTATGGGTAHKAVKNISTTNLKAIYNYSLTCTYTDPSATTFAPANTTYTLTDDWYCLPGYAGTLTKAPFEATSASTGYIDPINCYISETGSGTFSTWSAYNGFSKTSLPNCVNHEYNPTTHTFGAAGSATAHENLFENSMHQISLQTDAAYALYYFSFGKFSVICPGGICEDTASGFQTQYGQIDGITANQASIQGPGAGQTAGTPLCTTGETGGCFPVTRGLYNVYNNSHASGVQVTSNQATLNFVSEYGFLCKSSTKTDIDPQTNVSYRTEIETDITTQGFFPLDTSQSETFPEGSPTYPAVITDAGYAANDPTSPTPGYCLVSNGG